MKNKTKKNMLLLKNKINLILPQIQERNKQFCLGISLLNFKKDSFHTSAIIFFPPKENTNVPEVENEINRTNENLNLNNLETNTNTEHSSINNNPTIIELIEFDGNIDYQSETNEHSSNYFSDSDVESENGISHLTDLEKFEIYDDLNQTKAFYGRLSESQECLHESLFISFVEEGLFTNELNSSKYAYVEGNCLPDILECSEEEEEDDNSNEPDDSNPSSTSNGGCSSNVTPGSDSNINNNENNVNSESLENNKEKSFFNKILNMFNSINYLEVLLELIFTTLPIISKKLIHLLFLLF